MVSLLCHVLPFMSRAYSMGGIPLSNHGQQKGSPANSDDVLPRNQLMQIGVPISDLTKKKLYDLDSSRIPSGNLT